MTPLQVLQVLGELQWKARSLAHLAMHGFLISPQEISQKRTFQLAALHIQKNVNLPGAKAGTAYLARKHLLD
jgi:hypothetical protein